MSDDLAKGPSSEQSVARPTLAEVARRAGVDKSTVSRALRDDSAISAETRARVQQVAAYLHYVPNANARRLSNAQTNVLAFASRAFRRNDDSDQFLMELLAVITREAVAAHFDVLLCCPEEDENDLQMYERILGGHHADGIILMDLRRNDPRLDYLCARGYPHVLFGRSDVDIRRARRYPYPWVEVDNRFGVRAGMEHLLALGHTRIAFVGGDFAEYFCVFDRHTGYHEALQSAHIANDPELFLPGPVTEAEGYRLAQHLLGHHQPPTAIFAFGDVMAAGVMRAAHEAGRVVGRDLAVVGFDGLGLGRFLTPSLTTLRQPLQEVGRSLVQLLIAQIQGNTMSDAHVLLCPELEIRASTGGVWKPSDSLSSPTPR